MRKKDISSAIMRRPYHLESETVFIIEWMTFDGFFGEFSFRQDGDSMIIGNECMDKDSIAAVLEYILENAELKDK